MRRSFCFLASGRQLLGYKHDQASNEPGHQGPDGRSY